jgi:hypothetical protein
LRLKAFPPMRVYEITLSREAQTLSMSEPRGGPEFKSVHSVWTDWQTPLPWTAGLRKERSLDDDSE